MLGCRLAPDWTWCGFGWVAAVAWCGHLFLVAWSLEFLVWCGRGVCCVYVSSERFYLMPEVLQPQETGRFPIFEVVVGVRKF